MLSCKGVLFFGYLVITSGIFFSDLPFTGFWEIWYNKPAGSFFQRSAADKIRLVLADAKPRAFFYHKLGTDFASSRAEFADGHYGTIASQRRCAGRILIRKLSFLGEKG